MLRIRKEAKLRFEKMKSHHLPTHWQDKEFNCFLRGNSEGGKGWWKSVKKPLLPPRKKPPKNLLISLRSVRERGGYCQRPAFHPVSSVSFYALGTAGIPANFSTFSYPFICCFIINWIQAISYVIYTYFTLVGNILCHALLNFKCTNGKKFTHKPNRLRDSKL